MWLTDYTKSSGFDATFSNWTKIWINSMSKQGNQRKQKERQLGGLDASVVVGEATDTTGLDGDQMLILAGSLIS